jgi:hypothetical protein
MKLVDLNLKQVTLMINAFVFDVEVQNRLLLAQSMFTRIIHGDLWVMTHSFLHSLRKRE